MAKVVVLPKPVPSTNLAISVTPVVFSTVAYDSKANITPNNSTDLVQWQTGSYKTTYLPANGRQTKFVFDKTYVDPATFVNKDTAVAGYPAKVAAIAGDTSTPSRNSASAPVAVGGLAASRVAQDAGLKWQVSGLSDLQTASESTNPWKYQWQFFDGDGKKLTTPTTAQGVTHTSGTIATIDALNSDQNILTFARDSSFMKDAAAATTKGKPYRAQVTFTTTASDDSKKRADNTITVSSNVAELQVTKPAGKLSLDQVPNFNFGDINVSQVYNGTKNAAKKPEVTSNLAISDTRVGANDWQLTVNMTPYKTVTGTNLVAGNVLRLISDLDTSNTDLIDNNTPVTVATSAKTKPAVWPIKAQLLLNANPNIDIFNHQRFISTVTWNLSSNQVAVPTAQ
ncbi:WxL domain-containing protein [Weissella diestrammenae]|uniref:WxL domain-containing protein n=2 Tax=Weissella diestrammenae TaxID=1162633 RepID=A0A7G9T437_9LACO|nr:WxL domain-containing protein [Weissella diestrammenae]QNN74862.1 WxL domain-containing protein [Weissella diestrammenae]